MMSTLIREFIGRDQELTLLARWLGKAEAPSIVYIHDALKEKEKKGGVGKTWLLRMFYEFVGQEYKNIIPVTMDFFNVLDRDGVVIAEKVAQAIKSRYPQWPTGDFEKLLQEYREAVR